MNILRRASLSRLLLLCGLVVAIGVSATAIASALDAGPVPPPKPLADAVHDALSPAPVEGVSANVKLTNHLLEGASLASGDESGQLTSSPLVAGGSGRLWIAKDGRARLELQAEGGDTQVLFDGHTLQVYDGQSNTLYRYTPPAQSGQAPPASDGSQASSDHEAPSVAKIEETISKLSRHLDVSGALPSDVAGQPAYTVRVAPKESGSLLGGAELSWDAVNGVPLRTAVYSSASSSPVIELAASEISFATVDSSVFSFAPPPGAKVQEVRFATDDQAAGAGSGGEAEAPKLTTHGQGPATIAVLESKTKPGEQTGEQLENLPKVTIAGAAASELRTELGTLLTFERSGVRYLVAGAVSPAAVEELARGL